MRITIYIEGGGDSKELHTRCREGFRRLFAYIQGANRASESLEGWLAAGPAGT